MLEIKLLILTLIILFYEQQYLILSNGVPTYVSAPNGAFIKAPGRHNSQTGFITEDATPMCTCKSEYQLIPGKLKILYPNWL